MSTRRSNTLPLRLILQPPQHNPQPINHRLRINRLPHLLLQLPGNTPNISLQPRNSRPLPILIVIIITPLHSSRRRRRRRILTVSILIPRTTPPPLLQPLIPHMRVREPLVDFARCVGELFLGVLEVGL